MKPALALAVNVTVVSGCTQRDTDGAVDVVATPPLLAIVPEMVMSHHSSTFLNVKSTPPSQEAPPLLLLLLLLLLLVEPHALLHWVHAVATVDTAEAHAWVSSDAHAEASAPVGQAQLNRAAHAVSIDASWVEQLLFTHVTHAESKPVPALGQFNSE
jgi:hypothetical protein